MLKKLLLSLGILLFISNIIYSQGTGSVKGKVVDDKGQPAEFANVSILLDNKLVTGASTDLEGNFFIKSIPVGKYDLKVTYQGMADGFINGVSISDDDITFLDKIKLEQSSTTLKETKIIWVKPLVDKKDVGPKQTLNSEDIKKMTQRTPEAIAMTTAGVQGSDGNIGSVRGSRPDGLVQIVDGMRVTGGSGVNKNNIESVTMITGGVPAKYGEATGGVLITTTKGPSKKLNGGIELAGSLDGYNDFIAGFSLTGPILKHKDESNPFSLLGFFLSAEFTYAKDNYPAQGGTYRVKNSILSDLEKNPIFFSNEGIFLNREFTHNDDLENIRARENASSKGFNIGGKLDYKTTETSNLTFGGSFDWNRFKNWSNANSLMNSDKNGMVNNYTYRVFGRFNQYFKNDTNRYLQNIKYDVQMDYQKVYQETYDPDHKDNLFDYGYVGKFKTYKSPFYERKDVTINGIDYKNLWVQTNIFDTLITFDRSETNPLLANYTSSYFDYYAGQSSFFRNYETLRFFNGLTNGDRPDDMYGIYNAPGAVTSGYTKFQRTQLGFSANASADLGRSTRAHNIEFGFQYEQRTTRSYTVGARELWQLMKELTNSHIKELDKDNPIMVYSNDGFGNLVFTDTVRYDRKYAFDSQKYFDKSIRTKLGYNLNSLDWIDIDNLDPSAFSLDMFSAEDLINGGGNNSLVSYYGYDYTGKKITGNQSIQDFFNKTDANGNLTRNIGAYNPIYMSGYIQDKFAFDDLIFNLGFRLDRFDANQSVLKDNYLLAPAYTVSEVTNFSHPSSMGSDYVVYVDNADEVTKVIGYRNENTWFNKDGIEVQDPSVLSSGTATGRVTPYLVEGSTVKVSSNAFTDYKPQYSIMPRINFSFPVSDEAIFFAHYDVITKRPFEGQVRMDPLDYLYISKAGTSSIANPNLKPEKKVDYEIGFKQALSKKTAITINAYYAENRDQIQSFRYSEAYPNTYYSYGNLDFGTTSGFSVSYDLRQTDNITLLANYTLQFAKGTGSSATSSKNIVTSGQPNLRTLSNLDFDQRHSFKLNIDFRYYDGQNYNGWKIEKKSGKVINVFENMGINFTFTGTSGNPYTRSSRVTSINGIGTSQISGSLNGSFLPWQFWMDATIDKSFMLKIRSESESKKAKVLGFRAYLSVLNVLNFKNIRGVYQYTGNPDDDGFLAAAEYQQQINSYVDSQSFIDIYRVAVANPYNYSLPRRIKLGVQVSF